MDARLNAFLERAESVLARLEPLLPAPRPTIDWCTTLLRAGSAMAALAT